MRTLWPHVLGATSDQPQSHLRTAVETASRHTAELRPGPTGRRAALTDGPDVWEVVAALHAIRAVHPRMPDARLLSELSIAAGLIPAQIATALGYYAAYSGEIDERIALNDEAAERAERLWEAQHP